jgi:hypothetical protein
MKELSTLPRRQSSILNSRRKTLGLQEKDSKGLGKLRPHEHLPLELVLSRSSVSLPTSCYLSHGICNLCPVWTGELTPSPECVFIVLRNIMFWVSLSSATFMVATPANK